MAETFTSLNTKYLLLLIWSISLKIFSLASDTKYLPLESEEAYISWKSIHGSNYEKNVFLPTRDKDGNGVAVHWTINDSMIRLAAATRARGWIGFGIAEAGGMPGADVVLFSLVKNGDEIKEAELIDAYVEGYVTPSEDTCQDWKLLNYVSENGILIFEAERALDTKDPQDRPILDDSNFNIPAHRVIAAWGDDNVMYHGLENRLQGSIRFYGSDITDESFFSSAMDKDSEGYFDLKANDYQIGNVKTNYGEFCFGDLEFQNQGVNIYKSFHLIGLEPLIDAKTAKYVHHFVVFSLSSYEVDKECAEQFGEMVYVWAPGEGPLNLPSEAGLPFGKESAKAFRLQIHYNNPELDEGLVDNSGVRFYYTSKLRKETMGILQLADPIVSLSGKLVGEGLTRHEFVCPSSCTQEITTQNFTVVREMLHLHQTGIKMINEQIRNGEVIRYSNIEYYDYNQNGLFVMQQEPFIVKPGDSFKTTCYYNAKEGEVFGFQSDDEMCISFLMYYPKTKVSLGICGHAEFEGASDVMPESCFASYKSAEIKERDLGRVFGTKKEGECTLSSAAGHGNINKWRAPFMFAIALFSSFFFI